MVIVCGDGTLDGGVYAPLRVGFLYTVSYRREDWEMGDGAMGADEMMREPADAVDRMQTTRGIVMSSASKQ